MNKKIEIDSFEYMNVGELRKYLKDFSDNATIEVGDEGEWIGNKWVLSGQFLVFRENNDD